MARRANYNYEKRQKELKRQKKQEAKRVRRMGLDKAALDGEQQPSDATDPRFAQLNPGPAPATAPVDAGTRA